MIRHGRREFLQGSLALAGIGLLAGCGIIPPWVQSPPKVPRIGFLSPGSPLPPNTSVFFRALADLGYIDGQNIMIEQRYAEGNANRLPELAADLVKLAPD